VGGNKRIEYTFQMDERCEGRYYIDDTLDLGNPQNDSLTRRVTLHFDNVLPKL